ncbi:YtxH domain-containing protein [Pedobacter sp. MC2016-14]|uniref:YtxH domain-containing protein n=1 Tax=Pedobacter sp. MC2016-14 TaxID=2897327 RepID=UPI001E2B97E3|nr:YtxH domain-containing protein [Pedobacter sp. MC2016-14]MCD0488592.1 YtxH domain-containing protein [Pedobacter sp. MC2016-14]
MGLFKTALIGAAVYGAVKYITKKDVNGRSIADDIKEKAPEWLEKAKGLKEEVVSEYKTRTSPYV